MSKEVEILDRKIELLINALIRQADHDCNHDLVKVLKEIERLV